MSNGPIISCDDHIDLSQLPADLWTSRVSADLINRAPRVEERNGAATWVFDGKPIGRWAGKARSAGVPAPLSPVVTAFDRGKVDNEGQRRPAVPNLRLQDMDRDGVFAHVMFGPVTSLRSDDARLRDECCRAYNDWLVEFCAHAPDRLIGVAMLPESPDSATQELQRLADRGGVRQANIQIADAKPRLHDPSWEPFWSLLEETGIILSFHVTVFAVPPDSPAVGKPAATFAATKMIVEQFLDPFVDLFAWGIFERHPRMKLVLAEGGVGWLPWLVQELDYRHHRLWEAEAFWAKQGGIPLKMKPSELFKRQVYATFQEDDVAMCLIPFFGDGNLLWASDYPHPDSVWPNSLATIDRQMKQLSPETRRKLTYENAAALYGVGAAHRVAARA